MKLVSFEKCQEGYRAGTNIKQYEIRHYGDIKNLFEYYNVVVFVKSKIIQVLKHIRRAEGIEMKRVLSKKLNWKRPLRGRPY